MLCKVCKDGLEGMWDPCRSKRLALLKDFIRDENSESTDNAEKVTDGKYR